MAVPNNNSLIVYLLLVAVLLATSEHSSVDAAFGKKPNQPPVVEGSTTCDLSSSSINGINEMLLPIAGSLILTGACCAFLYQKLTESFQSKINNLQVQLSGKTNSAFVFIKPHACKGNPGEVEAVVENGLAKAGIRITGKGEISAETIDEKQLIDNHYGAIASKAVVLKPNELNVPDKGKAAFQEMFGESWQDALAAGNVYNAKDGAAKLGVDGAGLEVKWRKLEAGKNLIKFGGGFYCGKVDDIYVMNAFYMAMRAGKYDNCTLYLCQYIFL